MAVQETSQSKDILDYRVVGDGLKDEMEYYINNLERDFPDNFVRDKDWDGMLRVTLLSLAHVARNTYRSIIYLSDTVSKDPKRKIEFAISAVPLNRVILEEVFTVLYMSDNIELKIEQYCKAGWRHLREEYDRNQLEYAQDADWKEWFNECKKHLDDEKIMFKITPTEEANIKSINRWPTPGTMTDNTKPTEIKDFMRFLFDFVYRPLSQGPHLTYSGLAETGSHFLPAAIDYKEERIATLRTQYVFQAATFVLSFLGEIENIFKFGHKEKLKYLWTIVSNYWPESKALYKKRYKALLE